MNKKQVLSVGRPSTLSAVPDNLKPFVETATDWVLDNKITQIDALEWLSGKIRENGFPESFIPSVSGFNRHVRRVQEKRERAAARVANLSEMDKRASMAVIVKALRDLANAIEDMGPQLNEKMSFEVRLNKSKKI